MVGLLCVCGTAIPESKNLANFFRRVSSQLMEDYKDTQQHDEMDLDRIRRNTIASNSRDVYQRSNSKFIVFLHEDHPGILDEGFGLNGVGLFDEAVVRGKLKDPKQDDPPLRFDQLTVQVFFEWLLTLRKQDGSRPKISAFNSHRAALFNLFRDYHVTMSQELVDEMRNHFKGLKRTLASEAADGNSEVRIGKDPLKFSLFKQMAAYSLKSGKSGHTFAHLFLIMCWNLMCRAGNAVSIWISHMEWRVDALGIYFAHMKNDQLGERPRDPRHIYANPVNPEICPILSLGIYLMLFPAVLSGSKLFPGGEQYDRFRRNLSEILRGLGVSDDIGSHSARKGASTYVSSGSTAAPSSQAINLRGGWAMGGVHDTYFRYEAAGDQYVGRTVCGLPVESSDFALLPPFFKDNRHVLSGIEAAFGVSYPAHLRKVLEMCLASVVYHSAFLLDFLPGNHKLLATVLFRDVHLLNSLRSDVDCRLATATDEMRPTGIPPHVTVLSGMSLLVNMVTCLPDIVTGRVVDVLEERAIGAGTVTRDGLRELLQSALEEAGLPRAIHRLEHPEENKEQVGDVPALFRDFEWGGSIHSVPQDFSFPTVSTMIMFQLWCCGDPVKGIKPFRRLRADDMPNRNVRKRLSDLNSLMSVLESEAVRIGLEIPNRMSVPDANRVFEQIKGVVEVQERTENNRRRRRAQLSWRTVHEDFGRHKRLRAVDAERALEEDEEDGHEE